LDTFSDKSSHHLFLEPEGETTHEYYLNGFSSSLPWDVQLAALRKVVGFENVRIYRPGYAIEYDYFPPTQLYHTLQTKLIPNLFFAGQINGTTGYEEAAAQGLLAGINASNYSADKDLVSFSRSEAYIGVLIDDLVTKGTDEPYRMFTSRAERRLILRQDNARFRLVEAADRVGIISKDQVKATKLVYNFIINERKVNVEDFIKSTSSESFSIERWFSKDEIEKEVLIMRQYAPYIEQEEKAAKRAKEDEKIKIPKWLNYDKCSAIRYESREKLKIHKPETLSQAARIPGVNPADIALLAVIIKRGKI
jgi:tRNA uridine 5-carboxymethylaminomethyl modification enzyme